MAFLSMVSINGNTCRLMTSTSPPSVKNTFSDPAAEGISCCTSPFFCIKRIQPIEAMYGGVINGIIKIMSNTRYRANFVRENRYANGAAIRVDSSTTSTPSSREFAIIRRFSLCAKVCPAW